MRSSDRRHHGFVLVLVLVLLAVLSVIAASVAVVSERAVADMRIELERFQAETDAVSTRETLLFLFATQRLTIGGLALEDEAYFQELDRALREAGEEDPVSILATGREVRLDGTPYRGLGSVRFAIQDDRGLISPNWMAPILRQAWMQSLDLPGQEWAALDARRLDYQDADDLHRLEGAEREAYAEAGRPPPSNRPFATPLDLRSVLGWDAALRARPDGELLDMLTVTRNLTVNVNTASREVLQLLPGIDAAGAERIVALRALSPIALPSQVQALGVSAMAAEIVVTYPRDSGNLRLWATGGGPAQILHWRMTPFDADGRPWRIDYELVLPREGSKVESPARPVESPLFPQAGPDRS